MKKKSIRRVACMVLITTTPMFYTSQVLSINSTNSSAGNSSTSSQNDNTETSSSIDWSSFDTSGGTTDSNGNGDGSNSGSSVTQTGGTESGGAGSTSNTNSNPGVNTSDPTNSIDPFTTGPGTTTGPDTSDPFANLPASSPESGGTSQPSKPAGLLGTNMTAKQLEGSVLAMTAGMAVWTILERTVTKILSARKSEAAKEKGDESSEKKPSENTKKEPTTSEEWGKELKAPTVEEMENVVKFGTDAELKAAQKALQKLSPADKGKLGYTSATQINDPEAAFLDADQLSKRLDVPTPNEMENIVKSGNTKIIKEAQEALQKLPKAQQEKLGYTPDQIKDPVQAFKPSAKEIAAENAKILEEQEGLSKKLGAPTKAALEKAFASKNDPEIAYKADEVSKLTPQQQSELGYGKSDINSIDQDLKKLGVTPKMSPEEAGEYEEKKIYTEKEEEAEKEREINPGEGEGEGLLEDIAR